ncbi:hypothetical protein niasHT_030519 [Heterodera trifolii]|uniref:C3H1-type domain-containing protein n=1 Tax=Heterodera trifolii TaxID=157864 RepID=A0ABD2IXF8_9BILA
MQRKIDNNSIQNYEQSKEAAATAALIKKYNESFPEANFPEMFPLSTPQAQPFSMAKRSLLAKNASTNDLTQYINPVLANRRRSSLFCTAVDPAMKRLRQREAYKTAMCQAWLEGRACVYGDQCNFAHGEDELQPLPSNRANPKHKTRICENYTTTGICPFGNRCFFIHPQTEEELDALLKLNENLPLQQKQLDHHHLEGEALVIQPPLALSPQGGAAVRRIGTKLKQFRKMDSCGTFNLPFQVQTEQNPQQQQQQPLFQWPSSAAAVAAAAITGDNFEQFPPLSSASVGMLAGKSLISMKSNVSTASPPTAPLIHSSSVSNLNYIADQKIENAERELDKRLAQMRMTMRKMSQQKSFSSTDVCLKRTATQNKETENNDEEDEKESSGPNTPPLPPGLSAFSLSGFYEQHRLGWSNTSSLASVWSPPATTEQQAVPTFSFFEANSPIGGGTPSIEKRGHQLLRAGKRSPDFEGILMGRRSSHIPSLEENNKMLLNVLEMGTQKNRNKSAEYLSDRCVSGGGDGGGGTGTGDGCKDESANGPLVTEFWQPRKRSTSEMDEENRNRLPFGDDYGTVRGGGHCDRGTSETNETMANGIDKKGSAPFKLDGHNANSEKSRNSGSNSNIQPIRPPRHSDRIIGISNLDKMQHLWTSSSPNLDNKHREGLAPPHQCWTPFGIQKVEIPSQIDLSSTNYHHDSSLNLSEQRDRIDTLTNANHREENDEEEELVNLYRKFHLNEAKTVEKAKHSAINEDDADNDNDVGGFNEFVGPTWAQMVRRKSYLRQKSHSSPAINRNCSTKSVAGGNL